MVLSGVASFRLLILESDLTYQYRSPVPVNAGARILTGAPLEKARMTPAAPTPAPMSALPEITAWMVSPAPCVPTFSSTSPCFLKMPASWPSVGAWFSQLLICPITNLSWSSAAAGPAAKTSGATKPNATAKYLKRLMMILPCDLVYSARHPTVDDIQHRSLPDGEGLKCHLRLCLAGFRLTVARGLPFFGAGIAPPALAARNVQEFQERATPVVLPTTSPQSSVSPRESEAMVPPIAIARTRYSALRHV